MSTATTPSRVSLLIHLPRDVAARVRQAALAERRSISNFGRVALELRADHTLDDTPNRGQGPTFSEATDERALQREIEGGVDSEISVQHARQAPGGERG
jgi:hypothetical protein